MTKKILVVLLILSVFLVGCSDPKVSSRKITGAVPMETQGPYDTPKEVEVVKESEPQPEEKSAAETLKEIKETTPEDAVKPEGSTLYPPVETSAEGRDALKERTKAAFSKSTIAVDSDGDKSFGSKYYQRDGDPANLPPGYGEDHDYD